MQLLKLIQLGLNAPGFKRLKTLNLQRKRFLSSSRYGVKKDVGDISNLNEQRAHPVQTEEVSAAVGSYYQSSICLETLTSSFLLWQRISRSAILNLQQAEELEKCKTPNSTRLTGKAYERT